MSCRLLSDRGAGTVLVVAGLGVVMFVGLATAGVTGMVASHRRAQSAADLAAIAGATAIGTSMDPCAAARVVATENGAAVDSCESTGAEVTVAVSMTGPALSGWVYRPKAEARAGR